MTVRDEDLLRAEEYPSLEVKELFDWADATARDSVKTLNDSLRQLVTLATALLAGSAALLKGASTGRVPTAIGAGLVLIALALALWGSYPYEVRLPNDSEGIRRVRDRGLRFKSRCLGWAGTSLALALAVAILGLLAG